MIKEQSDSFQNWFLFDDRNIINDLKNRKPQLRIANRLERPADYCNLPLAKFNEDENCLGKSWKLKYLFVFVRHGQRASVNSMMESSYRYYINCSLRQFPSFKIHDWKEFINSLDKSNVYFTKFDMKGICKESQLTLLGILQIFILGSRLKNVYQQFLKSSLPTIFSTPYQRTLLSSEIIQYQLLKDIVKNEQNRRIQESQSLVFCRPTSNVSCQCPSLRYFYSKYNRYISTQRQPNKKCTNLIDKFHSIFSFHNPSGDHSTLSLSSLFDIMSSALCASNLDEISKSNTFCWPTKDSTINQEPWSFLYKIVDEESQQESDKNIKNQKKNNKGNDRCIPLPLITDLWNCIDDMTEKLNNHLYFRKYSKLAVYPILNDIVSRVTNRTSAFTNKNTQLIENKASNLLIYVGHDHTLRYLLAALDFKGSMDRSVYNVINQWPGFASRLVIEVFKRNEQKSSFSDSPMKFRLLYDGLNITSALSFCPSDQSACDFSLLTTYLSSGGYWNKEMFSSSRYSQECITV